MRVKAVLLLTVRALLSQVQLLLQKVRAMRVKAVLLLTLRALLPQVQPGL